MSTYEKLLAVQSQIKAPKGQFNEHGGYNYRSCEDILEAAKPHLAEQKCVILLTDDLVTFGDRFYVKAEAHFVDVETGDSIRTTAFAREEASRKGYDSAQITGAASSYARKYALNGLLSIDDNKDVDGLDPQDKGKNPSPRPKPAPYACEECGQVIADYKDANGKWVSAKRHVNGTKEKFKKCLCLDCVKRRQEQTLHGIAQRATEHGVPVNTYDPGKSGF